MFWEKILFLFLKLAPLVKRQDQVIYYFILFYFKFIFIFGLLYVLFMQFSYFSLFSGPFVFWFSIILSCGQWRFKEATGNLPGIHVPTATTASSPTTIITPTTLTIAGCQLWNSRKHLLKKAFVMFHAFACWDVLSSSFSSSSSLFFHSYFSHFRH